MRERASGARTSRWEWMSFGVEVGAIGYGLALAVGGGMGLCGDIAEPLRWIACSWWLELATRVSIWL